jgi:hypothetical protein
VSGRGDSPNQRDTDRCDPDQGSPDQRGTDCSGHCVGSRIGKQTEAALEKTTSRRGFLKAFTAAAAGAAAVTTGCSTTDMDRFFQEHYKEMSPADKEKVFARISADTKTKYSVDIN